MPVERSKVADLPRQFSRAAAFHAHLVTVQSGGNDVCSGSRRVPRDTRRLLPRSVEAAFEIPLASACPTLHLRHEPDGRGALERSARRPFPGNESQLSDGTLCDPQLDARGVPSAARRREIQVAEQRYNAILRSVCSSDVHCRYDGGAFSGSTTTVRTSLPPTPFTPRSGA